MILDLFAGPGGWSEGLRMLGLADVGIEWDAAACATRAAAGHLTIRADVAQYPPAVFAGKVTGVIASPPCQDFSLAGKQAGRTGEKGQLIDTVPEWVDVLRPEWVACEQVPPALPVWEEFSHLFRSWGYSTWCGVLNAANYGVPQTRKRAILLASRVRAALPPEPTHAKRPEVGLFGTQEPWVTMAQALGWGMTRRPCITVTAGSGRQGGPDLLDGGSGARATLKRERKLGWMGDVRNANGCVRSVDEPSPTLTASMDNGNYQWIHERPATTVVGSFRPDIISAPGYRTDVSRQDAEGGVRVTVAEGGVLQSFPADYPWQGSRSRQYEQVGNAVPPLLAAHIIAALTGAQLKERAA